jgi:hypothetical protein
LGRFFCTFSALLGIISLGATSAVIAADHDIATDESPAKAGPYIVGGIALVNYNISTSDLQELNTGLLNLGFSSALSSTDNTSVYFKVHGCYHVNKNFAVEGVYTSLGQLEINTTLTGP